MLPHSHQHRVAGRSPQTARTELSYLALASPLAFRLLPYGLSVTSLPVGQPLPNDALQRLLGARHVIHTPRDAVAIAEIELREIAMQVLLFAVLVDALHAALEDRIEALNRVGGDDVTLATRELA